MGPFFWPTFIEISLQASWAVAASILIKAHLDQAKLGRWRGAILSRLHCPSCGESLGAAFRCAWDGRMPIPPREPGLLGLLGWCWRRYLAPPDHRLVMVGCRECGHHHGFEERPVRSMLPVAVDHPFADRAREITAHLREIRRSGGSGPPGP